MIREFCTASSYLAHEDENIIYKLYLAFKDEHFDKQMKSMMLYLAHEKDGVEDDEKHDEVLEGR